MKLQISLSLSSEAGVVQLTQCQIDVMQAPDIAAMGLSLADSKVLLAWVQGVIVNRQIEPISAQDSVCSCCGMPRQLKDYQVIHNRTLFCMTTPKWSGGALAPVGPGPRTPPCRCENAGSMPKCNMYTLSSRPPCMRSGNLSSKVGT